MKSIEIVQRIVSEESTLVDCLQLISQIYQDLTSQKSPLSVIQANLIRVQLRLCRHLLDSDCNLSPEVRAEVALLAAQSSRFLISRGSGTLILDRSNRLNFHG